jgi:TatD DNase family protein
MLIDTHCHLDAAEFDVDRNEILAAAVRSGVQRIVVPAVEVANFGRVAALARQDARCVYALGIHPMYVDRAQDRDLELLEAELRQRIDDPALVAVGEIGLDFFVEGLDRDRQLRFFQAQLELARAFDLPVILHVRRSQDTILKYLRRAGLTGGIAHAFNGSVQQAEAFLELNFALGFGGAMTFERALRIRALARELPASAHVLETDAPDIAPSWIHRQRNEPSQLAGIARVFAGLRGIELEEALAQTGTNTMRVLPRLLAACSPSRTAAENHACAAGTALSTPAMGGSAESLTSP